MINKLLPVLFLYAVVSVFASKDIHRLNYPVYKSPEILITDKSINVILLAKEISTRVENIGVAKVSYAGDLLRNQEFLQYIQWYTENFHPLTHIELLRPRSSQVQEILKRHWGKYIVHSHQAEGKNYISVFLDSRREPVLISQLERGENISSWIASTLFENKPERRLTESEREAERLRPEDSYYAPLRFDKFIAIGMGQHYSLSYTDPEPFDGFSGADYQDSADIYRWSKIHTPMYRLNLGFLYEEIMGAGLVFNYSGLRMTYNPDTHKDVSVWFYNRYEFGVFGTLGKSFHLGEDWMFYPHAYMAFQYAIFNEEFKIGSEQLAAAERVKIPTITGATGALGTKIMYNNRVGIDLSYGLTHVSGKSPENFQDNETGNASGARPKASKLNEHFFMVQLVWNSRSLY